MSKRYKLDVEGRFIEIQKKSQEEYVCTIYGDDETIVVSCKGMNKFSAAYYAGWWEGRESLKESIDILVDEGGSADERLRG